MIAMRNILLLVLCFVAFGVVAQPRNTELCANGRYHQLGFCPADLSAPASANVFDTSADCLATNDRDDDTAYACVTTSATPLSVAEIVACSGGTAVAGDQLAISAIGQFNVTVSGLSASTNYYCQLVQFNESLWPSDVVVSAQFTTDAPSPPLSQWVGVPDPAVSFGYDPITITEPADPGTWPGSETVGQYYIDGGAGGCSDANTYGFPDTPRCTVPDDITLNAGDKMVIVGNGQQYATGGDGRWQFGGTGTAGAGEQIWFVGRGATNPLFNDEWRIGGGGVGCDHCIFDSIEFNTDRQGINFNNSSFVTYRNAVNIGPGTASGNSAFTGASNSDHVVYYNLEIAEWGDDENAGENDYHAVLPGVNADFLWLLNSHIHNNGGDSIQVGQANLAVGTWPEDIFIAGNLFHSDRENAVDVKDATRIVISQNRMFDYGPVSSSSGECVVIHDDANEIWILSNVIYNCNLGVSVTGNNDIHVLYNEIRDLNGTVDFGGPYFEPNTAVFMSAVTNINVSYNTIHNAAIGVQFTTGVAGTLEVVGNLFGARNAPGGWDMMYESSSDSDTANMDGNLYTDARNRIASTDYVGLSAWQAATVHDDNAVVAADPLFTDEAGDDFTLQAGSAAVDAGALKPSVLADYVTDFGLAIEKDNDDNDRPAAAGDWDIGAYERQ